MLTGWKHLSVLGNQHGHLANWCPVFLAFGIGLYFSLPFEPRSQDYTIIGLGLCGLAVSARFIKPEKRVVIYGLILLQIGFLSAGFRAHMVKGPVLARAYYGAIEGRIIDIDRSATNKIRLTLDQVRLQASKLSHNSTPLHIRISLQNTDAQFTPRPGMRVMLTGYLSPPQGPTEPQGFDFKRNAWFKTLGAIGYSRMPVLVIAPPNGSADLYVFRLRKSIYRYVMRQMPPETGAFAGAIITGDRSGIDQQTIKNMRKSNLAHLLAISGLHMGLLAGFLFNIMQFLFALFPYFALRYPVKKFSALIAFAGASLYLVISGAGIATERAYIMVAVMLIAVVLDQRALSLRSVALGASIVLLHRPESLVGPGFQMSFAATTALVATYGGINTGAFRTLPKPLSMILTVGITSAIAGAATAPIAAAHFNQIANYGLLANILTVPIMGLIVMPFAVLAFVLAPFGLAWVALKIMGAGVAWILWVAAWIANIDGAVTYILAPAPVVLPCLAVGGIWLTLWRGRARLLGVLPMVLGLFIWSQTQRPDLLVSANAGLTGVMTDHGRAFNKKRGDGFTARAWLENDGDGGTAQYIAAQRGAYLGAKNMRVFSIAGQTFAHLTGKNANAMLEQACMRYDWVIVQAWHAKHGPCQIIDKTRLEKTGALAVIARKDGLNFQTTTARTGKRLWNTD